MKKIISAIVNYFLNLQDRLYNKKQKKILASSGNGAKTYCTSTAKLEIKNKILSEMRDEIVKNLTPVIKENVKTPEKILDYIEKSGTPVYKIENANKILATIGEQEGFITPLTGMRAVYLNYVLRKKFSTRTDGMFVLRDLPINIYVMTHQAFKWYGWKIKMPGYDEKTQDYFKRIWLFEKDEYADKLTYNELANLKEAIERDKEAIDFVIKLASESEGAQDSYKDMKDGGVDL